MHSITLVLLPPPFGDDLRARADALLEPHRLDEEHYEDGWRTDYWTIGREHIRDEATERALGIGSEDAVHGNVCLVRNLPHDVRPGAVITPDGTWHDLFDFGWRFSEKETPENRAAWDRWSAHVQQLLEAHTDCVAIELDTHS